MVCPPEWNDERIEALTKFWRQGLSASQVARQLGGVSRSAVIGKVHRLGIAGRDIPTRPNALGGRPPTRLRVSAGGVRQPTAPRPAAAPRIAVRTVFEVAATASIQTLTEHACRWPIGEPEQAGFGYCGRACASARSYCDGHSAMAVRRRDRPMQTKEIERIVTRFVETPATEASADTRWRESA